MKTQIISHNGKETEYTQCPKCEVWIPTENFKNNTHERCEKYQKNLESRKKATVQVLQRLNAVAEEIGY